MNQISNEWKDYILLDAGNKEKLESWKGVILRRPDPVAIWPIENESAWNKAQAVYHRSNKGGGKWEFKKPIKDSWVISYKDLLFKVSPTGFKHTGLFPEQAANWDFIRSCIEKAREQGQENIRILNLFAYTGGATVAAAKAGAAEVVHVDASKGMNEWAKENIELNHLNDVKVRFLVDDVLKFLAREKRRGRTYDGIIMDPPSYGRGPKGEIWKIEENIYELVKAASELLSDQALFFLVNIYSTGFPLSTLTQLLAKTVERHHPGIIEVGETLLPIQNSTDVLPCGLYARWIAQKLLEDKHD